MPLPNLLLCALSPEHALFFPVFIWEAPPGLLIGYQFAVLLFKAPHLMQLPILSSSLQLAHTWSLLCYFDFLPSSSPNSRFFPAFDSVTFAQNASLHFFQVICC